MPSHGPTEPPDESHGWEDEYDEIMTSGEAAALLHDLRRLTDQGYDPVESDDDTLQAFVQMVYDRGIAHGYGNAKADASMAALADELAEQDRLL